jgi:hypothetical protein
VPHVAEPVLPGDHRFRPPVRGGQRRRHLADGTRVPAAGVVGREGPGLGLRLQGRHVRRGHVPHVHEVPALASVLEHPGRLAAGERRAEEGRHPGIGGVARHPGAVHVVVPQRHGRPARAPGPRGHQVLLGQLGRRVHVPGVGGGLFTDQAGGEVPPALGAPRLEPARVEVGHGPWARPHGTVPPARVRALPVDDHRTGEHEVPHARVRHGGDQHGRTQVVARDVLRRVGDPVAEADHRRLVAHGVHTGEGRGDGRRVADVRAGILPDVVHERLVPARPQCLHHMGPDEPGTAGDQYAHGATLGGPPPGARAPGRHVTTP